MPDREVAISDMQAGTGDRTAHTSQLQRTHDTTRVRGSLVEHMVLLVQ